MDFVLNHDSDHTASLLKLHKLFSVIPTVKPEIFNILVYNSCTKGFIVTFQYMHTMYPGLWFFPSIILPLHLTLLF
jgi:hypothetical protein